jgi:hypothetical protein
MVLMWNKCSDKMPEIGQRLWYYFKPVGRWRGTFEGYYVSEKGVTYNGMHIFVNDEQTGFLTGDVTHWHNDQEEVPNEPV